MAVRPDPTADFSTHADPLDRDVTSPSGLGPRGWLRWVWGRLTSMRTALILLLLLGIASIPGSLIPQRTSDELAVSRLIADSPEVALWYDRFGLFDVYGSPWFAAVYLLLFVSLVGCLVPRARQHWRLWRRSPSAPPRNLSSLPDTITLPADAGSLDRAEAALRAGRWKVRTGPDWTAGEKGFVRETGNQVFHFALLGVLTAVGLGALNGWHGSVVIREGQGFSNTLTQYDTFTSGRFGSADDLPPFSIQLRDFDATFERGAAQRGAPREFRADVLVTEAPGATRPITFGVNDPLVLDEAKVFLIGHGYAPRVTVRDVHGRVVFSDSVVFLPQDGSFTSTGVIKVPDSDPQLGFRGIFAPTAVVDQTLGPVSVFPAPDDPALFLSAFTGDLGLDSGEPQNVYTLDDSALERIGLKALRVGETWRLPDGAGSVRFDGVERYMSVKVGHEPGGVWALGFIGCAVAGLSVSLFARRRRLWVRTDATTLTVGGVARGEGASVADDVRALAHHLDERAKERIDG